MHNNNDSSKNIFYNHLCGKKELQKIIAWTILNHGPSRTAHMVDNLKDVGFYYATKAGISLSISDLYVPPKKSYLLQHAENISQLADFDYYNGRITATEKFQKIIETWQTTNEILKEEVFMYFKEVDVLNPVYIMSTSGARGNTSQVSQLVSMRGLMSDPQGRIINLPIKSNFREGLTVSEYLISCYGARKGLVDTAIRTADSGYLTRRLVDVAQGVVIQNLDCRTANSIPLTNLVADKYTREPRILMKLESRLVGRVLAENIICPIAQECIAHRGDYISEEIAKKIVNVKDFNPLHKKESIKQSVLVRSPLTCQEPYGICQNCYGWSLAHRRPVDIGEAIGIIAAQSIGEPGTQLTMRTFHTGGVFSGNTDGQIRAPFEGIVSYSDGLKIKPIRSRYGDVAFLSLTEGYITTYNNNNNHPQYFSANSILFVSDGQKVYYQQLLVESSPRNIRPREKASSEETATPITVEKTGQIYHQIAQLWLLFATLVSPPKEAELIFYQGDNIEKDAILYSHQFSNPYPSWIRSMSHYDDSRKQYHNAIIASECIHLDNCISHYQDHLLPIEGERFKWKVPPGSGLAIHNNKKNVLSSNILGTLINDIYSSPGQGRIGYLEDDNKLKCFWMPEESYRIGCLLKHMLVRDGEYVHAGTQLMAGEALYAKTSGIVQLIIQKNESLGKRINNSTTAQKLNAELEKEFNIESRYQHLKKKFGDIDNLFVLRIGIFTGRLIKRNSKNTSSVEENNIEPGLLKKGQQIQINSNRIWKATDNFYIEAKEILIKGKRIQPVWLLRPLKEYIIPESNTVLLPWHINSKTTNFYLDYQFNILPRKNKWKFIQKGYEIITVNLIYKSSFLKSSTILDENNSWYIEWVKENNNSNDDNNKNIKPQLTRINDFNITTDTIVEKTQLLAKPGQLIKANEPYAVKNIFSPVKGFIYNSKIENQNNVILVTKENQKTFNINSQSKDIIPGSFVKWGTFTENNDIIPITGRVVHRSIHQLTCHIGRNYQLSNQVESNVTHNQYLKINDTVAYMKIRQAKTGDIVQGLPRIEQLLEARLSKIESGQFYSPDYWNLHTVLDRFLEKHASMEECVTTAVQETRVQIQLFLMNRLEQVYLGEGVDISDKHIEIMIRQMTSRVAIVSLGAEGTLSPNQYQTIRKLNYSSFPRTIYSCLQHYIPVIFGITKASLNTQSFISEASFQSTTRILTTAAVYSRTDILRGLKENVIIGRLIPAGTGFLDRFGHMNNSNTGGTPLNEWYVDSCTEKEDSSLQNVTSNIENLSIK